MLAGLGGGVVAGRMLSGGAETAAAEASDAPDDHEEDAAEDEEDGHGEPTDADSGYEYLRLNNQFIVPLIRHGSVRSLVVLSLTLEIESGATETVYDRSRACATPCLRVMFAHANVGGFDGSFTSVEAMTPLREGLREAARQVLGEIAHDVLITDIVRQDA